jgi:meiotically up-regulated gene 157 (Mug157) protein
MSLIVGIMTSDDDDEIKHMLSQILSSTGSLGLIHESINVHSQSVWTRSWFSWANGLFGQMLLDLKERKPHLLKTNFQGDDKI